MSASEIVNKVWNYAHVLRDDGVSYGDYVEAVPALPWAPRHLGSLPIAFTYLIFLKMADERLALNPQGIADVSTEYKTGLPSHPRKPGQTQQLLLGNCSCVTLLPSLHGHMRCSTIGAPNRSIPVGEGGMLGTIYR